MKRGEILRCLAAGYRMTAKEAATEGIIEQTGGSRLAFLTAVADSLIEEGLIKRAPEGDLWIYTITPEGMNTQETPEGIRSGVGNPGSSG